MAQLNITLNQEEILQLLSDDREGAFKKMLQDSLNSVLKAESTEQLNAAPYERSQERTDSRNGSRTRGLNTRIGTITLAVPRHRNVPFKTMIFDSYKRSESALITTMAEMVVSGVSTRKVSNIIEELCGTSFSKSTVSEVCKELDTSIQEFCQRPLKDDYPFVIVDATYFKVRDDHRIISKAMMIALGITNTGMREILGFQVFNNESKPTWLEFFNGLKKRGLTGVKMITSDAHEGILNAVVKVFPGVPWQRCQYHFSKNIMSSVPAKYQKGLITELQEMFQSKTLQDARAKRDSILNDYYDVAEKAMECLENGFEDSMTVMAIPSRLQRVFRTSNYIERLNSELKRRSKVIGIFPNEGSILRLMGAVLIEQNEHYQTMNRIFFKPDYIEMLDNSNKLELIALEQLKQLEAA